MSNYNKSTNFAVKDTLTSGDPDKVVSGAEIDNEFNSIASAVTSKADKVAAATTNNFAGLNANGNLIDSGKSSSDFADATNTSNSISSIESNITDLQNDKSDKVASATTDNFAALDANGNIKDSGSSDSSFVPTGFGVPTGSLTAFAATTAPTGWIECDGRAINRSANSNLFNVIGTTFGNGNGSTTFNVPDLRGEFVRGWDDGRGADSGRAFGSAQSDAFQGHHHAFSAAEGSGEDGGPSDTNIDPGTDGSGDGYSATTPINDGTNGVPRIANETRPRNIALMYIIKT